MGLFDKLFGGKEGAAELEQELVAAGVCPNCWGTQAYDGKFEAFVEDQTKANVNHDKAHKKAFVQQFIETGVTGIRLKKEGDLQVCLKCGGKYKHVSAKAT